MNKAKHVNRRLGFLLGAVLVAGATGCVGYVERPQHHQRAYYQQPQPVYVEPVPVVQEYVYYPSYQVYYSRQTRQYVYPEGQTWVSRPAPPRVSVDVLIGSPSVRLDFNDHPSAHHSTVARQYPRNWAPDPRLR
jgi:hypothetical protein